MEFLKIDEEINYLQQKFSVIRKLEALVTGEGYTFIEPVYFEEYEEFIKMNKRIKKESMVKVLNSDGSILILRPDATTSIINQLIPKWRDGLKLKLFYYTTVFNNSSFQMNEISQFGIEYLGESSVNADLDVIKLVFKVLKQFKQEFIVKIGNSKFLDGLLAELHLDEIEEQELKELIYYKNQYELERFIQRNNIKKEFITLLKSILSLQGTLEDIEEQLSHYVLTDTLKEAVTELKALEQHLCETNLAQYAKFDLAMLAEYDYYDGITFKGFYPNIPIPILSGGRYDGLTKRLGNTQPVPAIGFSVNSSELIKEVIKNNE